MIIHCGHAYGFRDARDLASMGTISGNATSLQGAHGYSAPLGSPYIDLNGDGVFGDPAVQGEYVAPWYYNYRNHRTDVISFFARDLYHRQTGNPGVFVDNMSANEAWIWYGHLWLPDNNGNFPPPSSNTVQSGVNYPPTFPCMGNATLNPNNFFGNQLVLGRVATLLSGGNVYDQSNNKQWYLNGGGYWPFPFDAASTVNTSAGGSDPNSVTNYQMYQSRTDLSPASIHSCQSSLIAYLVNHNLGYTWYNAFLAGSGNQERFQCNPFVAKPMQSVNMAQASPYLLGGCSQFIVEYAGDYLRQVNDPTSANYGNFDQSNPAAPTDTTQNNSKYAVVPDGQIDYQIITDPVTLLKRKQIIWYGLPRNTSNTQNVDVTEGDVAPLWWWIENMINTSTPPANPYGFEDPGTGHNTLFSNASLTSMKAGSYYTCAWGPNDPKPKLIRITLTISDPTGRLPDGQTYQYVFPVP
jgi:hypothetical protein